MYLTQRQRLSPRVRWYFQCRSLLRLLPHCYCCYRRSLQCLSNFQMSDVCFFFGTFTPIFFRKAALKGSVCVLEKMNQNRCVLAQNIYLTDKKLTICTLFELVERFLLVLKLLIQCVVIVSLFPVFMVWEKVTKLELRFLKQESANVCRVVAFCLKSDFFPFVAFDIVSKLCEIMQQIKI